MSGQGERFLGRRGISVLEVTNTALYAHSVDKNAALGLIPTDFRNDNLLVEVFEKQGSAVRITRGDSLQQLTVAPGDSVQVMGLLRPVISGGDGNHTFHCDFGQGNGTGRSFSGGMGAQLSLAFTEAAGSSTINRGSIATTMAFDRVSVDFSDWVVKGAELAPASSQGCSISVLPDPDQRPRIEASIEIHVLDRQGRILGVISPNTNNDVHLATTDFFLLCFISYLKTDNDPVTITYQIGNPVVSGKVIIREV